MRKQRRIFITGITDLLGKNLLDSLLAAGFHITALVRDIAMSKINEHPNLNLMQVNSFGHLLVSIGIVSKLIWCTVYHQSMLYSTMVYSILILVCAVVFFCLNRRLYHQHLSPYFKTLTL